MALSRRAVLEQLAKLSDARQEQTTTQEAVSTALGADTATVETHLQGLEDCELIRSDSNGRVRVTITGEELLELDIDEMAIIHSEPPEARG